MKIVVCIKQVPDTVEVKIDPKTGTLIRDGVPSIINHDDKTGIEAALTIREQVGGTVTVVSMGPPQADVALREALAMGCDEAILVSAREFGGSDTYATSGIIAAALKQLDYDLIITGRQAIDGDTAQVGPQISEHLDIPVISYARKIEIEGDAVKVQRQYDDRYHVVKAQMPCLITCLAEINDPRYMTPGGIFDACEAEIKTMGRAELKTLEDGNMGLAGSPTKIAKASDKVRKGAGEKITLDTEEAVSYLLGKMTEKHVCGL